MAITKIEARSIIKMDISLPFDLFVQGTLRVFLLLHSANITNVAILCPIEICVPPIEDEAFSSFHVMTLNGRVRTAWVTLFRSTKRNYATFLHDILKFELEMRLLDLILLRLINWILKCTKLWESILYNCESIIINTMLNGNTVTLNNIKYKKGFQVSRALLLMGRLRGVAGGVGHNTEAKGVT